MSAEQERELAVFKNVHIYYVYPGLAIPKGRNYEWIASLHLTERRIYATPNGQPGERLLKDGSPFSVDLAQVVRISLHRHSWRLGSSTLVIRWKTGSHFWNRMWIAFQLSYETFEQARSVLPSIMSLAGKVKV